MAQWRGREQGGDNLSEVAYAEPMPACLLHPLPVAAPGWRRIRFHYFPDEELRCLSENWKDLVIRTGKPDFAEVPGGIVPKPGPSPIKHNNRLVCVYDGGYCPVQESTRIRDRGKPSLPDLGPEDLRDAQSDGRSAYFLGTNARHYGHFLLETLCRAWAWNEHGENRVAVVTSPRICDFVRSFAAFIPGLAERIEGLTTTTKFASVAVPAPAFSVGREAFLEFKVVCEQMADRALPDTLETTEQPLYLSRAALYTTAKRFLVGEVRLERFLEKQGFRVVRPESLPAAEQIALFNRHKWIVTPIGSACHSRLFARQPLNLIVLCHKLAGPSNGAKASYALCDLLSEGTAHYASVFSAPDIGAGIRPEAGFPVMLEEDRLLALLKDLGLIRADAAPDEPAPDMTEFKRKCIDFAREQLSKQQKGERMSRTIAAVEASLAEQACS